MIRIRTAALGLALSLFAGATALAQGGPPGGGRGMGANQTEMLLQGIELSEEQKGKLKTIDEKYAPKQKEFRDAMMAARERGERPGPEQMQQMRELQGKQRDEIRGVLTTEQQVKFDANVKQMQERMQRRGPPGGGR